MADFKERRFSIDPGKGKKMDGCPYSIYEDGRDVKDYIIPPKGCVFKGFIFDPDACNQIYDGKLTAQYEKEPLHDILKSNLWKFIFALAIIAIIALVVVLAVNVFNKPKNGKVAKTAETTTVINGSTKENTNEPARTDESLTPTDDKTKPSENDQPSSTEQIEKKEPVQETKQPETESVTTQFKKDFWTLIHQRTILMNSYDELYNNNKNKVECEEYDYLKFTILKGTPQFKEWSGKLRKIPADDLASINTVNDLKNKLKEIQP